MKPYTNTILSKEERYFNYRYFKSCKNGSGGCLWAARRAVASTSKKVREKSLPDQNGCTCLYGIAQLVR